MAYLTPASSLVNLKPCPTRISRDAFKLGISGEQDVRTTAISSLSSRFHSRRLLPLRPLPLPSPPPPRLTTPPLTEALQDPDQWVKLNATWALSQMGASVPLLSHWLEALQHHDPNLRRSAAKVFEDSGSLLPKVLGAEADNNTVASLVTVLSDDDSMVRRAAEKALNLLGTDALPGLIEALKAPEPLVRLQAAELLGNLGESAQSAVPDLLPLLRDTGRYVPPSSNGLFPAIPRFSNRVPPSLQYVSVPANPQQLVRVNAAIALGKLGDRSAIPALITAVRDNNPWMQLASGWALLKFGEMQGLPVVGRLVQHPEPLIQRVCG